MNLADFFNQVSGGQPQQQPASLQDIMSQQSGNPFQGGAWDKLGGAAQTPNDMMTTDASSGRNMYTGQAANSSYLNSLRQTYKIPPNVSDQQVLQWSQQQLPGLIEEQMKQRGTGSNFDQLKEFAGVPLQFGAMAAGGPVGGSIAAMNMSGASSDMGIPRWAQNAGQLAGTMYSGVNPFGGGAETPGTFSGGSGQNLMGGAGGDQLAQAGGFNPSGSYPNISGPSSVVGPEGIAQSATPGALPGTYNSPSFTGSVGGDPLNSAGMSAAGLGSPNSQDPNRYGSEYGQQVDSGQQTQQAGLGQDPSGVAPGGAMDMNGSNSMITNPMTGSSTNDTIFGGNASSPGGAPGQSGSLWDQIRNSMGPTSPMGMAQAGMGLAGGLLGLSNANKAAGATSQAGSTSQPNIYNYRMNDDLVNQYLRNPMSVLQNNPGYQASVDYLNKEGSRKMAQGGFNDSGNKNYYLADTLGKNADKWFTDSWQPIRDAAGVQNYPNMAAMDQVQLNAQKQIMDSKNKAYGSLFSAGSDLLPSIFKYAMG